MIKHNQKGFTPIILLVIYTIFITVSIYILANNFLPKNPPPKSNSENEKRVINSYPILNATSSATSADSRKDDNSRVYYEQHITPAYKYVSVIELIKQRQPYPIQTQTQSQSQSNQSKTPMPTTTSLIGSILQSPTPTPVLTSNPTPTPTSASSPSRLPDVTLWFAPSNSTFNKGCSFSLDVDMDTANKSVDGVDVLAEFDPGKIIYNSVSSSKTFNGNGVDVLGESYNNNVGSFSFSALSRYGKPLNGSGKIAILNFSMKPDASGTTEVRFHIDTSTATTSDVIEYGTIDNILKKVINGSYAIGSGSCP